MNGPFNIFQMTVYFYARPVWKDQSCPFREGPSTLAQNLSILTGPSSDNQLSCPFLEPSTLRTDQWWAITIKTVHYKDRSLWQSPITAIVYFENRPLSKWPFTTKTVQFKNWSILKPSTLRVIYFMDRPLFTRFENLPATFIVSLGPREFATLETVLVIFLFAVETFFLWTAGLLATLSAWRLSDGFYRLFSRFYYRCF